MEINEIVMMIATIIGALMILTTLFLSYVNSNNYAVASDKAQKICEMKGYDTYHSFNTKFLGDVPLGVRCNHIGNKKEIILDDNNNDILVSLN